MKYFLTLFFLFLFSRAFTQNDSLPYILVLGVAQDGGYPHIGCQKEHCINAIKNDSLQKNVVALALVVPKEKKWFLFEATPDISKQLHLFGKLTGHAYNFLPDGIFITHAHIGHYTGLMYLGREALGGNNVPVYVMPKMKKFLETNGPWGQLAAIKNIELKALEANSASGVAKGISVKPFLVPHRDEYSETAGFQIITPQKKYLFIPDIDKWEKFNTNIVELVKENDIALLDATFFNQEELPNRNIKEVPHPFVSETMELFKKENPGTKKKLYFIHFNHTNPLMWNKEKQEEVRKEGFNVAQQGMKL